MEKPIKLIIHLLCVHEISKDEALIEIRKEFENDKTMKINFDKISDYLDMLCSYKISKEDTFQKILKEIIPF